MTWSLFKFYEVGSLLFVYFCPIENALFELVFFLLIANFFDFVL